MRLGLLLYDNIDIVSGGYLYDRKLVEHFRSQGDQVDIVSLPRYNYRRLLTNRWIDRIPLDRGWDVMLQDELCHPSLWRHNRELRRLIDCPVVAIVHHLRCCERRPAIERWLLRRLEGRYLRSVDGFIYHSQATLRAVEQLTASSLPKVQAPPGRDHLNIDIDDAGIRRRCFEPGPLRLLFAGNIIERKRLHDVIEAMSHLNAGTVELTVVGRMDIDPKYYTRLRRRVTRLGLSDMVEFTGPLEQRQLEQAYCHAHVLTVPSSYEGYGIVYLEAMGYGVVPIGAASGGAAEVFSDPEEGFLIKTGDVDRLARLLRRLGDDRDRLYRTALAGRQRFECLPTWNDSMGKIREFVRGLVS
jgi:glycosyltransferase involved in cell wall biosynthesis